MTNPHAALHACRELVVEHVLVEQRVRHRDEERVDVPDVQEARRSARSSLMPAPIAPIWPLERSSSSARQPDSARSRKWASIVGASKYRWSRSWMKATSNRVMPEAQPAPLDRAHDPVVRVVEDDLVRRATQPRRAVVARHEWPAGDIVRPSWRGRTRHVDGRAARLRCAARTGRGRTTEQCRSSAPRRPKRPPGPRRRRPP